MTTDPIGIGYVEIRPAPGSKESLKRDVRDTVSGAGRVAEQELSDALGRGAKAGRLKTEEQLRLLDASLGRQKAVAETVGQGIGRAAVRVTQLAGAGLAATAAAGILQTRRTDAAVSQLESGLKSTGAQAGLTEKQMLALAGSVERYSGQASDSIVQAEAQLTAYRRVQDQVGKGNDIFTRATKATADLSQRLGGDAAGNAKILGRALEDPVRGLSALITKGVFFDAQQIKTIQHLEDTGRHLEAQKVVLDQVEKTVGGAAKAYGQTLPGAIDRAKASFETHSESLIRFADDHRVLTGVVAGTAGSLYVAVKAVKAYREIRDTLFKGTAERIAANLAEAKSIDAIAAAEARAAGGGVARGGAAAAGRGGLLAGLGGLAGGGAAAGGAIAAIGASALAVGAAGIHSIGTVKRNQEVERLEKRLEEVGASRAQLAEYELSLHDKLFGFDKDRLAEGYELLHTLEGRRAAARHLADVGSNIVALENRSARSQAALAAAQAARRDPSTLDRGSGVIGGPFDALPSRSTGDVADARQSVRDANRAIADAQRDLTAARRGGAGASRGQIAAAEAAVLTARDATRRRGGNTQAEQLRLEAAEARLSDLRAKGGTNADKVRQAEEKLAQARRNAGKATKDLHDAEKGTALSAQDVLARITGQRKNSERLVADEGALIGKGVTDKTLLALQGLEKSAPGTFDKLAKSLTPAMAKALNAQYAAVQKANFEFYDAPRVAALRQAEAAAKADKDGLYAALAKAQADAWTKAQADQQGRPTLGDPRADAAPHGTSAPTTTAPRSGRDEPHVSVTLTGYGARQVRHVAAQEIAHHDRSTAVLIATGAMS